VDFDLGEVVELRAEAGWIVVESVQRKFHRLDRLPEGITAENLHGPVDFGPPQGEEIW
jgi:antitoxin component of MazEF toxin-antitoxin module